MFKYIYKGHDCANVEISRQSDNAIKGNVVKTNEIKKILTVAMYLHRKQLGASSSLICIERLQYHLPNQQMVLFDDDDDV